MTFHLKHFLHQKEENCSDNIEMDISKIIKHLITENISITAMESCTSGLIASTITDTEGASAIFKGSYVSYSNEEKIRLGVPAEIIKKHGVYSKQCAYEMAKTAQRDFFSDIAIGITGTTGNSDPNNDDSIVGLAYFCILFKKTRHDFIIQKDVSGKTRKEIKEDYTQEVFSKLSSILETSAIKSV